VDLALGLVCGLTGALCYGLSDVGATVTSRRTSSLIAAAGMQVTMLAAYVLLAMATGTSLPGDPAVFAQVAFFGCLVGLAFLLAYEAFRLGPLAVVGPVLSLIGGLTVVLAVVVLGEQLKPLQGVGVVTATAGLVLMAVISDTGLRGSRLVGPGVVFALVAIFIWSAITIGLTGPIRQVGALPVMVESRIASTAILWSIMALAWGRARARRRAAALGADVPGLPTDPTRQSTTSRILPRDRAAIIGIIALMGVLDAVGFAAVAVGLEKSAAWLVALTSSLGPSVTLIFGMVVLGERLRRTQWIGLVLVFASLVLVSLP
jgi:drug/metabolite transporter (DMT)-like permease